LDSTSHLLINLLVILVALLFLQYWLHQPRQSRTKTNRVVFVLISVTISFCMLFPIKIANGIIFDLRFIPFVLGCLYAQRKTRIWIIILIVGLRLSYGVDHSGVAITNLFIFYFLTMQLKTLYFRLPVPGRITLSTLLIMFMSIWTLVGVAAFYDLALTFPLCISFILVQTAGMVIVSYLVESIREQQIVLQKLYRMEKMEVVSHLAASISHEIRNPLTSTRGFLQLLSESKEIPAELKDYIAFATSELDQAERIIRDYLTFAKPTHNKLENLNIRTEIEKAVRIVEPLAKMSAVNISFHAEPSFIKGNSGMVQQVLINIIKNGIEAMPSGGNLSLIGNADKSAVTITIKDEGVGMTDSQKNRLGEPYFTTKDSKGTGLGMMVVFRIVESMNGIIEVESEKGKGTNITLTFPKVN
jgi:two-component system sporulation sensor kinase B